MSPCSYDPHVYVYLPYACMSMPMLMSPTWHVSKLLHPRHAHHLPWVSSIIPTFCTCSPPHYDIYFSLFCHMFCFGGRSLAYGLFSLIIIFSFLIKARMVGNTGVMATTTITSYVVYRCNGKVVPLVKLLLVGVPHPTMVEYHVMTSHLDFQWSNEDSH